MLIVALMLIPQEDWRRLHFVKSLYYFEILYSPSGTSISDANCYSHAHTSGRLEKITFRKVVVSF